MKYIAIKDNSFLLINAEMNEENLLNEGYTLYSFEEYQAYLLSKNTMTTDESIACLESRAGEYFIFGNHVWNEVKRKVFAINVINKSSGIEPTVSEMQTLLSTSDMLQKSLESGSFYTAIYVANSLKSALPQYAPVCDFVVLEINNFLRV